ncbi:MAG: hypothetical protein JO069_04725 [Verrucomicrobia bacterium]|nr:hypothetical protein [Verrucomicrobiota bacterium]
MAIHQNLQTLCKELDQFRVAAAVGHVGSERLGFWNRRFAEVSTLSDEELKLVGLRRILVWEDLPRDLAEDANPTIPTGGFTPCVLRPPEPAAPILGKSVQRPDGHILILLEPEQKESRIETDDTAGARLLGREQEAQRARRVIHDEVSPELLAAAFGAHSVGEKLRARQAPETGEMARVIESLDQAIQRLIATFSVEPTIAQA